MLMIAIKKLLAKRWMFFCMLLGCVLLIATTISLPLYENATYDKVLRDIFKESHEMTGEWPATYYHTFDSRKNTGGAAVFAGENLLENMGETLGVTPKDTIRLYTTPLRNLSSTMGRDDDEKQKIQISMLSDAQRHMELLAGNWFTEDGVTEEGYLEAVITLDAMLNYGYLVDEVLEFHAFKGNGTENQRIKIVGIVQPIAEDDFWNIHKESIDQMCFISEDAFDDVFLGVNANKYKLTCYQCFLFEYMDLWAEQVAHIRAVIADEVYEGSIYEELLTEYEAKCFRVEATLLILQIPILLLLLAFLFMVSKQMYQVELNEIAVMKSRGSSGGQLFRLYLYQTGVLVLLGVLFGIPLSLGCLQLLGSASGFLEFGVRRELPIRFDEKVLAYLLVAIVLIVGGMSIPAILQSKQSIVNVKQGYSRKKKSFWEKAFLDVVCLVAGFYGYYTFRQTEEQIAATVINNEPLNPLLYLSSTLLIVGFGLVFLRLLPFLVMLVYRLGEKHWSPGMYAAFQEWMRSNQKQHFVMIFLIMSVAFGIYHVTVAQTIMDNALKNAEYTAAVDVVIKEEWRDNSVSTFLNDELTGRQRYENMKFYEADYSRYQTMEGVKAYTKVYFDDTADNTKRFLARVNALPVTMMLIHPAEFGKMTWVERDMLDEHYYTYLNLLTDNETGFLISRNLAEEHGFEVGTAVSLTHSAYMLEVGSPDEINNSLFAVSVQGKIVGIVDCWPGYVAREMHQDQWGNVVTKDNYLVVGNYLPMEAKLEEMEKAMPYEVWIDMEDDTNTYHAGQWINDQEMQVIKYRNKQRIMSQTINDPLLQGTNGILTLEFLVVILVCGAGYLMYWMMSIRDRELMFGIFRAFGMHKRELFGMLLLEQMISGVMTALVGVGIGKFVCKLFAPMMIATYTAARQTVIMELQVNPADMMKLYVSIGAVLVLCMIVLVGYVVKLDATKALKLGED